MYSQAGQDIFVKTVLQNKRNGFFLEIGSNDARNISNTYLLENQYDWSGLMIEYDTQHIPSYNVHRKKSKYIISDAQTVDYYNTLKEMNYPTVIDYLQIDLEVENKSTINTLELLNNTVFDEYKFRTVTFEHDIYRGDFFNTRARSREIFQSRGYELVFPDVVFDEAGCFEDWYVYPDLVNMEHINPIKSNTTLSYKEIINRLNSLQT